jgi:hypothetical protein
LLFGIDNIWSKNRLANPTPMMNQTYPTSKLRGHRAHTYVQPHSCSCKVAPRFAHSSLMRRYLLWMQWFASHLVKGQFPQDRLPVQYRHKVWCFH